MTTEREDNVYTMTTGVRVRLGDLNPATLTEVQSLIHDPPIPMVYNPETGRDEEKKTEGWVQACALKDLERANAMMDTLAMMGLELADDLPEDGSWLKRLKLLEKLGRLDLSRFDLEDEVDLEFLYKKHVALATKDWTRLFRLAGVPRQLVEPLEEATEAE